MVAQHNAVQNMITQPRRTVTDLSAKSGPAVERAAVVDLLHGEDEELRHRQEERRRPRRAQQEGEPAVLKDAVHTSLISYQNRTSNNDVKTYSSKCSREMICNVLWL